MRPLASILLAAITSALLGGCATTATPATRQTTAPPAASPQALFEQGRALSREGDQLRAEQYIVRAVRAGYPERRAIVPLLDTCLASGRLRAALAHAERFLRRHPRAWRVAQLTGALYLALGRPARARTELTRLLTLQPDASEAHYLLGVIEDSIFGRSDHAARAFERYLALAPRGQHADEASLWLQLHDRPIASETRP
jgi:tetratricopeptide (TPR) repeat protein